jgi:catechol 2,3-dioxygenase-like lactoylglutathione lyase family enzyme
LGSRAQLLFGGAFAIVRHVCDLSGVPIGPGARYFLSPLTVFSAIGGTTAMKPRISVITLAVRDLAAALAFYRDGLGWPTNGVIGTEFPGDANHASGAAVMFELENGLILALYSRIDLALDANQSAGSPSSTEFSLGQLVPSKEAVDTILQQAKAAGATVTEEPYERPWGIYSGYFQDPDGHLWEIIWNPQITLD